MKINSIYIVLAVAIFGISIYLNYKLYKNAKDDAKRIAVLAKNEGAKSKIIERYIAKPDSTQHAITAPVFVKTDAEKEFAISPTYVDSLKLALNIKTSQLDEFLRVKGTVSGTVKTTATADSLGHNTFAYNGKWLNFSLNTRDSIAKYKYRPELIFAKVTKGNWLTGRRTYNDISFADPNAVVDEVSQFSLAAERPKRFGIGIQTGFYYIPSQNKWLPAIGAGISYNLINF